MIDSTVYADSMRRNATRNRGAGRIRKRRSLGSYLWRDIKGLPSGTWTGGLGALAGLGIGAYAASAGGYDYEREDENLEEYGLSMLDSAIGAGTIGMGVSGGALLGAVGPGYLDKKYKSILAGKPIASVENLAKFSRGAFDLGVKHVPRAARHSVDVLTGLGRPFSGISAATAGKFTAGALTLAAGASFVASLFDTDNAALEYQHGGGIEPVNTMSPYNLGGASLGPIRNQGSGFYGEAQGVGRRNESLRDSAFGLVSGLNMRRHG